MYLARLFKFLVKSFSIETTMVYQERLNRKFRYLKMNCHILLIFWRIVSIQHLIDRLEWA